MMIEMVMESIGGPKTDTDTKDNSRTTPCMERELTTIEKTLTIKDSGPKGNVKEKEPW